MLTAYFDDSGNEPNSGSVFVLAGLMAKTKAWVLLTNDWERQLKEPPSVSYWRTSSDFGCDGLTKEQRLAKATKLADIIKQYNPTGLVFRLSWNAFKQAQAEIPQAAKIKPYEMLFHGVLASTTEYLKNNDIPGKIEFVFDCHERAGRDAINGYHSIKNLLPASNIERIGDVVQRDDKTTNPLQAADLFAWNLRRSHGFGGELPTMSIFDGLSKTVKRVYELDRLRPMFQEWVQLSNRSERTK